MLLVKTTDVCTVCGTVLFEAIRTVHPDDAQLDDGLLIADGDTFIDLCETICRSCLEKL